MRAEVRGRTLCGILPWAKGFGRRVELDTGSWSYCVRKRCLGLGTLCMACMCVRLIKFSGHA